MRGRASTGSRLNTEMFDVSCHLRGTGYCMGLQRDDMPDEEAVQLLWSITELLNPVSITSSV
jgi:hypothetical protein